MTIILLILIAGIWILILWKRKESKKAKYQKIGSFFIIAGIIILLIAGSSLIENTDNQNNNAGFTIEKYKIQLDVSTNNKIKVTEEIDVNFYEYNHHGIYKIIPYWLEYTGKDNKTIKRKAKINNLQALNNKYSIESINGKAKIKIGDPEKLILPGNYSYQINYEYDMGTDPFEGFDEFIFHAFGDYWSTPINNASIEITMPSKIDESKIKFFTDKYRKNDISNNIDYYSIGNTMYINIPYQLKNALTIDYELTEGYFRNTNNIYGKKSLTLCLLVIFLAIISFYLWLKNGKDLEKVTETVEFYPPENFDAAEIGYLYKQIGGNKLAIALIVELASKGFIKIDEKDNKTIITNLKSANKDTLTENERLVYEQLFQNGSETNLKEDKDFYKVFLPLYQNLSQKLEDKINDIKSYKIRIITSIFFLSSTLMWLKAYAGFKDLNPNYKILYTISFIAMILTLVFTILMKRKSSYGEKITAKINSFKNYLETAEKNQLELLTQQNAYYFYNILPYAYVLDVSKKWIQKFEDIKMPTNEMGSFDYYNMDSLGDDVYTPSSNNSSSGGCSSCGGGCSSCGGGGSW